MPGEIRAIGSELRGRDRQKSSWSRSIATDFPWRCRMTAPICLWYP